MQEMLESSLPRPTSTRPAALLSRDLLSRGLCLSLSCCLLFGCSGDDDDAPLPAGTAGTPRPSQGNEDTGGPNPGGPNPGDSVSESDPVYALLFLIWSDDRPTGYVKLGGTLDESDISLSDVREVPGYASIASAGGELMVASGDEPSITRYAIGEDLSWQEGPSLSFANQGVEEAGFFRQYLLNDDTAYTDLEANKRVVWDPTAFEIRGVTANSTLPLQRDGLSLLPTSTARISALPRACCGPSPITTRTGTSGHRTRRSSCTTVQVRRRPY
ncbi:MAG: hypothetical protein RL685_5402 [Pseudomonadota bacterium]|jgi:hypothetical protein